MCNIVAWSNSNLSPLKILAICNKFTLIIPKVGILIWDSAVRVQTLGISSPHLLQPHVWKYQAYLRFDLTMLLL